MTGEWRYLAMLNYVVDPALLLPYVPQGTQLDTWHGSHYVSVVGFLFRDTKLLGLPIPLHRQFEEVNLRFYVRRVDHGVVKRGVTFVKEIVPRRAIAFVARLAYNEPYVALPMRHVIGSASGEHATPDKIEYSWRHRTGWSRISVEPTGMAREIDAGSEEEFITEHFWGYTRQRDGGTVEYEVAHPRWLVWQVASASLSGNLAELYGPELGAAVSAAPRSAFLAEGSGIVVRAPTRLKARHLPAAAQFAAAR